MSEPAAGPLLPVANYTYALILRRNQELHQPREGETLVAWKQFRFNWLLLAVVLAVFDLCLLLTDFHLRAAI